MNNINNSNRVVINLDGDLDDLDDDDITLPSMPVQSVSIIDNADDKLQTAAHKQAQKSEEGAEDSELISASEPESTTADLTENVVLGAPIVAPETSTDSAISPPNPDTKVVEGVNAAKTSASQTIIPTIPTMPLQAQLGDSGSSNHSASATHQPKVDHASQENATETQDEAEFPSESKKGSWFNRMKSGLTKSRKNLAEGMVNILIGGKEIDDELLEEVEDQLLVADIGVSATNRIIKSLTEQTTRGDLIYAHSLYKALQTELVDILTPKVAPLVIDTTKKPFVILVVGVNGVGKTTTIGKLAKRLQGEGKSVMLAAGDTFRAAATEQLQIWGERNDIPVIAQGHGSDSASVIFDAMQSAKAKNVDVLIADTAGRLQNKTHLMSELEKVVRVMRKADPSAPHEGMIVLDAGTGQNAINQVELFNKVVPLTGITITKLDGTAKGGVVFNIAETTDVPIRYIGVGESIDDLRAFSPKQFVAALFETDDKE